MEIEQFLAQLATLFRSRPYTKVIPFNVTFDGSGVPQEFVLWAPSQAAFELVVVNIRCDNAGVDMFLSDASNNTPNVIAHVMPPTTEYQLVNIGPAGYRSLLSQNAKLTLRDEANTVGQTVIGELFGFEVVTTREGEYYR